eukprot:gene4709-5045_t
MAGVASFMVVWWLEGTIRMGLTGLLPIVLLPLLGIANGTKISQIYFSDSVVVCLGSLIVASAVEIYRLHHRAAKFIIKNAKSGGLAAILGAFVFLTGMISMWLSNTATAALMIPLSKAILKQIENQRSCPYSPQAIERTGAAIDLSIAFAASLGGMATLTGTGSNLVLQGVMLSLFGKEGEVTFIDWFILAAPITLFNLFILWIILAALFIWRHGDSTTERNEEYTAVETVTSDEIMDNISNRFKNGDIEMVNNPVLISESDDISLNTNSATEREENEHPIIVKRNQVEEDDDELGSLQYPEIVVILVFLAMGALWLTREPPGDWGWANKLDIDDYATDGTVAIGACLVLMILPKQPPTCFCCLSSNYSSEPIGVEEENNSQSHGKYKSDVIYTPILSWRAIEQLNWDIIFLLGGGFALSHGFQASGLTASIAQLITTTGPQNLTSLIIISSILSCLCTNVMSNVAAANVLLPSLACVGPSFPLSYRNTTQCYHTHK